jgi:hypothetical protein
MIRKMAICLAAAVIATGGATLSASARGGGGHGGGGHVGMGHGGGHGGMRTSMGMQRPGHGPRQFAEFRRHDRDRDRWRHRRWGYTDYRSYGGGGGSCWRYYDGGREWVCPSGYSSYSREWYGTRYGGWRGAHGSVKGGGGKGGGPGKGGGGKGRH